MATGLLCLRHLRLCGTGEAGRGAAAVAAGRWVRDSRPVRTQPQGMPDDNEGPAQGGFLAAAAVLITGAASGIGLAVAVRCLSEGAAVAALDRDGAALGRAVAGFPARGRGRTVAVQADVADPEQVLAAVARAGERLGRLTAVVNVAGIGGYTGDIGQISRAEWARTLAVNLSGTFHVCRAALPLLRASGGGRVVNVSSQFGLVGSAGSPAYSAAKAGVIGLTRAMAVDHAGEGILVNCVCPGPIDTPMLRASSGQGELAARESARTAGRVLLGGPGRPEDVAGMIAFLLGPDAGFRPGRCSPATAAGPPADGLAPAPDSVQVRSCRPGPPARSPARARRRWPPRACRPRPLACRPPRPDRAR